MGSIVSGLFGKGGSGIAGDAVRRARELAPGARFTPFTVTTGTGTSGYSGDGNFYASLSPEYQNLLDTSLGGAQGLFEQFASFDPSQRAADIYSEQSALLQPEFQRQATDLQSTLFGRGTLGKKLAGESLGLGRGSGMAQADALGLGRAQQQTLAQLAAQSRQQALGEQQALGAMAGQALQAGLGISGLEQSLMGMGLNAEQARAAAALGSAQLELSPYTTQAEMQQRQQEANAGFFGDLAGAAATYWATSDVRLKKNINHVDTLPNGIKLYTWEWIDPRMTDPTYGVIAQEVAEVIPEAVSEHFSGYLVVNYSHPELQGVH